MPGVFRVNLGFDVLEADMQDKKESEPTLAAWLGFENSPKLSNAPWLGRVLGFLLLGFGSIIGFLSFLIAFAVLVRFGFAAFGSSADNGEAIRNIGLVVAAMFGAPFLVWRTMVAAKQTQISEEALLNNKINEAFVGLTARREVTRGVEQDGKEVILKEWEDDIVTRLAAMDRLEGLVSERNELAPRIVKALASYVRGNFPAEHLEPTEGIELRKTPRMDLQRAIDTIGRVYKIAANVDRSHWRLDLKACNFDGVAFSKGYFRAADFRYCRLEGTFLVEVNFEGCWLHKSLLNNAYFGETNLKGAKLDGVKITNNSNSSSDLHRANLHGVTLNGADITGLRTIGTRDVISKTLGTKDTQLSSNMRRQMPDFVGLIYAYINLFEKDIESLTEAEKEDIQKIKETGFLYWMPQSVMDIDYADYVRKFYRDLGMDCWPYNEY